MTSDNDLDIVASLTEWKHLADSVYRHSAAWVSGRDVFQAPTSAAEPPDARAIARDLQPAFDWWYEEGHDFAEKTKKIAGWLDKHSSVDTGPLWALVDEMSALFAADGRWWDASAASLMQKTCHAQRIVERLLKMGLVPSPEEQRNHWIYSQCCAGTPYDQIIHELRRQPESWPRLESIPGVKAAAERYAQRHGLPSPPTRQPGRPRKS